MWRSGAALVVRSAARDRDARVGRIARPLALAHQHALRTSTKPVASDHHESEAVTDARRATTPCGPAPFTTAVPDAHRPLNVLNRGGVATVVMEPGCVRARRAAGALSGVGGLASLLVGAALESVAEAPALDAGVDYVRAVGDPVDDGLGHARVGEYFGPFAEREVGGHDQ